MDSFRITQSPALLTVIATIIDPLTFYIMAVGNAECTRKLCVFQLHQMHLSLQNAHGAEKVLNVKALFSIRTNVNGSSVKFIAIFYLSILFQTRVLSHLLQSPTAAGKKFPCLSSGTRQIKNRGQ